jgi:hypothetical protein
MMVAGTSVETSENRHPFDKILNSAIIIAMATRVTIDDVERRVDFFKWLGIADSRSLQVMLCATSRHPQTAMIAMCRTSMVASRAPGLNLHRES